MRSVPLILVAALIAVTAGAQESPKPKAVKEPKFWAAVSVRDPVLDWDLGTRGPFMIHFYLVNDGEKVIDPKIISSKLFINGKECKGKDDRVNWQQSIGNGPRDDRYEALPPGDHLGFGFSTGDSFKEPGPYRIKWEGERFKAPEIEFRVMPRKNASGERSSLAKDAAGAGAKLWASLLVSDRVLDWDNLSWDLGTREPFTFRIALVNDGDKAIDPKIASSRLFINGKECKGQNRLPDWPSIVAHDKRNDLRKKLVPGDYLSLGFDMGDYFKERGTYRVKWKGEGFEAPEVIFRVFPRMPDRGE